MGEGEGKDCKIPNNILTNDLSLIIHGVPKNMGIQWRIRYRLCYELASNFESHNIIMSAIRVILWKG